MSVCRRSRICYSLYDNNGTAYKLFPEGNYSFEDVVTLPTGTSTTDLAVTLNGNGLTPGEYMLPIRLDNVSLFNIAENACLPVGSSGCRNQVGSCGLEYTS